MSIEPFADVKPAEISARINTTVLQQHMDNAAFLWLLRDAAVNRAPHYRLKDIVRLDERVEANLDGLRIAGDAGWELCKKALEIGEPGEVFAVAVIAFTHGDSARTAPVLELASGDPALERAVVSALGWLPWDRLADLTTAMLASGAVAERRIALRAFTAHRQDPGRELDPLARDPEPTLRARAFEAAGALGRSDLRSALLQGLNDPDDVARAAAAWSCARLGWQDVAITAALREIAELGGPGSSDAFDIALRTMPLPRAKAWRREFATDPRRAQLASRGAGAIGDPELVPELLGLMDDDKLARLAGEAFSMITGADLAYLDLDRDKPEDEASGPSENSFEEDVSMDADEHLPWPSRAAIEPWWHRNAGRFTAGQRYLLGEPVGPEAARKSLREGFQRQRAAAAVELGVLEPRATLGNPKVRGSGQTASSGVRES